MGVTATEPDGGVTLPTPLSMVIVAALLEVQLKVVLCPAVMHGLAAVSVTITGCTVTVTCELKTCELVPFAVAV